VRDKYAVVAAHRDAYPVTLMCRALGVSPSGFYDAEARKAAPPAAHSAHSARSARSARSAHAERDEQLRVRVRAAHRKSRGTYGAPRVHAELRDQGERVARKRVARLMREDGLVARPKRRRVPRTTDSAHGAPVAPNVLARRFAVDAVEGPDRAWVGDITYVPTGEGWLYLAVLLDLASRRVVGWATGATLERDLALAALRWALRDRAPAPGLVHHTDRGSQYASGEYRALLLAHGLTCSMSGAGDCYDNAVAESFFATLEHELLAVSDWATRAAARQALFWYIEAWYNRERRHSSLGYKSPLQYEAELRRPKPAA
jgi:transposase InsO family protein